MNHKIIAIFVVLIFAVGCLSIVSADDNNTTELEVIEDTMIEDVANYIMPLSISNNVIEFSDGFTGFCLDSTKESITSEDGFTSQGTSSNEIQNYVKLAIIEAYKQGCEDDLGRIIGSFADGSYKNSDNEVITSVLKSHETVGDKAVVELEDSIEATFEFELLKPADGNKSDCLAYTVSLKEVARDDNLTAAANDNISEMNKTNDTLKNTSKDDDNKTKNLTDNTTKDDKNTTNTTTNTTKTNQNNKTKNLTDNTTKTNQNNKTKNLTDNTTKDDKNITNTTENNKTAETINNETNQTILNKTNTDRNDENNTTVVNQPIVKQDDKTKNAQLIKEETPEQKLMKIVGNPIVLLIIFVVIVAIVAVALNRKD